MEDMIKTNMEFSSTIDSYAVECFDNVINSEKKLLLCSLRFKQLLSLIFDRAKKPSSFCY